MNNAIEKSHVKPYRVLCIDGGGMRGIYTAALLDKLAGYYARLRNVEALDFGRGFDLIAGTSTGAILGCAAAIGRPMSSIVALYEEHGAAILLRLPRPNRFPCNIETFLTLLKRNSLTRTSMTSYAHGHATSSTKASCVSEHSFAITPCQHFRWGQTMVFSPAAEHGNYTQFEPHTSNIGYMRKPSGKSLRPTDCCRKAPMHSQTTKS